ncbi:MAG: LytTR family DNA-binding domain-containing protein [Bacteroidota bacterium]
MKTIIVDNEIPARNCLRAMLQLHCPNIEIIAEADGVQSGLQAIRQHQPELVFLDIQLDDGSGLDILRQIDDRKFQVIFATAYDQYAIQAFKFCALDYLLKPIDSSDLIPAVDRARKTIEKDELQLQLSILNSNMSLSKTEQKVILKDADSIHIVAIKEIIHCQAEGSYTRFYLEGKRQLLVSKNLKEYENVLKNYGFYRPHHSHLVNINHIRRFDKINGGSLVMKNEQSLPVSVRRREQLFKLLAGFSVL